MFRNKIILIILSVVFLAVSCDVASTQNKNSPDSGDLTWEECIKTPNSVILQTYPEQCRMPDGRKVIKSGSSPADQSPDPSLDIPADGRVTSPGASADDAASGQAGTVPPSTNSDDPRAPKPGSSLDNGNGGGNPQPTISWQECIDTSGSAVAESYPRQCYTPDGKRAVEPVE